MKLRSRETKSAEKPSSPKKRKSAASLSAEEALTDLLEKRKKAEPDTSRPRKKRKPTDPDNLSFNPKNVKNPGSANPASILAMRTQSHTTIKNPSDIEAPLKISVIINERLLVENGYDPVEFTGVFAEKLSKKELTQFRFIIATEFNKNNSPIKGVTTTPEKEELKRVKKINDCVSIYSNDPNVMSLEEKEERSRRRARSLKPDFDQAAKISKLLKPAPPTDKKTSSSIINPQLVAKTDAERKRTGGRAESQAKAVVEDNVNPKFGRAISYFNEIVEPDENEEEKEWAHFPKPYQIFGSDSTNINYLIVATPESNSDHLIFHESKLRELKNHYPEGYELSGEVNVIPGTHIGTDAKAIIKTKHFTLGHTYDSFEIEQPHIVYHYIYSALIDTLVLLGKKKDLSEPPSEPIKSKAEDAPFLLFAKPDPSDPKVVADKNNPTSSPKKSK